MNKSSEAAWRTETFLRLLQVETVENKNPVSDSKTERKRRRGLHKTETCWQQRELHTWLIRRTEDLL